MTSDAVSIGLGWRLATSGGRGALVALAVTSVAVGLGTAILLFALSFHPALSDRLERSAWRDAGVLLMGEDIATTGVLMRNVEDRFRGQRLVRVLLAPISPDAPVPPGIPRLPGPGEAFVSPALARLMAAVPPDQLADGVGRVAGEVGADALRSPDELLAVVGAEPSVLREEGSFTVEEFPTDPRVPDLPPILALLVVFAVVGAMAPVAVFVATATRLSAARREQRLAALRLVGATPAQVARLAALEALIPCVAGAVLGVGLFFAARPLVARVPLDEATWFPDAIVPPLWQAALLLALVPVVGIVTAIGTLRRIVVTPLGVRSRQTPPRPRVLRLVPLAGSLVALLVLLPLSRAEATERSQVLLGLAFGGIVLGIALAGPWLTWLVGEALRRGPGGAATLLAARRLTDDPGGSFRSIAGVVMAVFVASAFFTFVAFARVQARPTESLVRNDHVVVALPFGTSRSEQPLVERLEATPGVSRVVRVVTGEVLVDGSPVLAWVVPCRDLLGVLALPGAACTGASVYDATGVAVPGRHEFIPDRTADGEPRAARPLEIESAAIAGLGADPELVSRIASLIVEPRALEGGAEGLGAGYLYVATDGATETAARVRSAAVAHSPTATVRMAEEARQGDPMYTEFGRVVELGVIGSLVLAGCSMAVAVTTATLDRRRQFALLRSAGMSVGRLRAVVLLQAGVPLVAVASSSALLGIAVAQLVLRLAAAPAIAWPDPSLAVVLAFSIAAAMGVVALTLPGLERLTRPESVRLE